MKKNLHNPTTEVGHELKSKTMIFTCINENK